MSEAAFPVEPAAHRRPRVGYALAAGAAALWAVNGTVSKVILAGGLSSLRLAEVRTTGAFFGLVLILAVTAPGRLRVTRRELPFLALFGIGGLSFVQWFYFLSIHRLDIGIALLIEYLAPILIALWAHYFLHDPVRRRIWVALGLSLAGLVLMLNVGTGGAFSSTGVMFALASMFAYAFYILLAEHGLGGRDVVSLLAWGFGFGTVFWAIVAPWWTFPRGVVTGSVSLLGRLSEHTMPVWTLMGWMIILGTILPFFLLVSALRHLSATSVGIIAMLEPVLATVVAWVWLGEALDVTQLAGAAIVLVAIVLAQTAR